MITAITTALGEAISKVEITLTDDDASALASLAWEKRADNRADAIKQIVADALREYK